MKREEIKRQLGNIRDFLLGKIGWSKLRLYNGWRKILFDDFKSAIGASGVYEELIVNQFAFTLNQFKIGEDRDAPASKYREIRLYENGVYLHSWGILSPKDLEPCVNAMFELYVIRRDRFYVSKKS